MNNLENFNSEEIQTNNVGFTGLSDKLARAIVDMGFTHPTEIQRLAIPLIRSGRDVIGRSQTGTGKTMAFAIPALEAVDPGFEGKSQPQVIILCPTRELAMQGCTEFRKLLKYTDNIKICDVYGGAPMERQIVALRRSAIVIGTPGRIMDHMRRGTLKLSALRLAVLDEADEMLSMGFKEDIETILSSTENRQTVLFSATMPPEIMAITREFQHDPVLIETKNAESSLENIRQSYINVPMGRKKDALCLMIRFLMPKTAIIFCNTKAMTEELAECLIANGLSAEALHGDLKQSQRTRVMQSFKDKRTSLLVATDVAARGIDVSGVDYVINYDLPQSNEYYVHRIGRTGRAGHSGNALTILSGRRQEVFMKTIARLTKSKIDLIELPDTEQINSQRRMLRIDEIVKSACEERAFRYASDAKELLTHLDAETAVAACLNLLYGDVDDKMKAVREFKKDKLFLTGNSGNENYIKLKITIGRDDGVSPNHIVGAVAECTGLSGKVIGKIEIHDDYTLVGIPSSEAESAAESMRGLKICGKKTETTILPPKKDRKFKSDRCVFQTKDKKRKDAYAKKGVRKFEKRSKPRCNK